MQREKRRTRLGILMSFHVPGTLCLFSFAQCSRPTHWKSSIRTRLLWTGKFLFSPDFSPLFFPLSRAPALARGHHPRPDWVNHAKHVRKRLIILPRTEMLLMRSAPSFLFSEVFCSFSFEDGGCHHLHPWNIPFFSFCLSFVFICLFIYFISLLHFIQDKLTTKSFI